MAMRCLVCPAGDCTSADWPLIGGAVSPPITRAVDSGAGSAD